MVSLGDHVQCPECDRAGVIVWISKNGQTIGLQCSSVHNRINYPDSYGFTRSRSKANPNSVFLIKTESLIIR